MTRRDVQFVRVIDAPYTKVRDRLRFDPATILGEGRADDGRITSPLCATLRGQTVERELLLEVVAFDEPDGLATGAHVVLRGDACHHPDLFPHLEARFDVVPVSDGRTALFFVATYTPPLGVVGAALDALALHRFAERSLHGLFARAGDRLEMQGG